MDQMQTKMSASRRQVSSAKLELKAKQNRINGLKWQLACLHKAMVKHTTQIKKLQAIANSIPKATRSFELGSTGTFSSQKETESFTGIDAAGRKRKSRAVNEAVQSILSHCEGSKMKAAEIIESVLKHDLLQQCYRADAQDQIAQDIVKELITSIAALKKSGRARGSVNWHAYQTLLNAIVPADYKHPKLLSEKLAISYDKVFRAGAWLSQCAYFGS